MKSIVRYIGLLIVFCFILLLAFFFWASSPNYPEKDYSRLLETPFYAQPKSDSILSIVTYNIGYLSGMTNNKAVEKPKVLFESNLKHVKYLFDSIQSDIIALQEIDYYSARSFNVNQQDALASVGYPFIAQAVNWDETYVPFPYWPPSTHFGSMLSGQSILSKYPLTDHQRIVLERVPNAPFYRDALYLERLAQIVIATIQQTKVAIINVHLEAFDKPTRINQFEEVLNIFKDYAKQYPTILLGDFNSLARDNEGVIQELISDTSIGNAAYDTSDILNTYSSTDPFKRIDYIFYTKNSIEYIEGAVLDVFGEASDHLPVMMQFKLK